MKRHILFLKYILLIFLQRGRERDRELETSMRDQLPLAHPLLRMCLQPRYMPLTGIEPGTFQSAGRRSIYWAKPVSAGLTFLNGVSNSEPFNFVLWAELKYNKWDSTLRCSVCDYCNSIGQSLYSYFWKDTMVLCSHPSWCGDTQTQTTVPWSLWELTFHH